MTITYDYEVVNLALVRLGANRITALNDGSKNANEANAIYAMIRDSIMRDHPWGFATRYQYLVATTENVLTVTGISKADPGVVDYTGTDPEDGDLYLAEDIGGMTELNDYEFVIHAVDTSGDDFELYDTEGNSVDTTSYGAWTAGGTFTRVLPPTDNFDYIYTLPSRVLRVIEINDDADEDFEVIENRYLLCNSDECKAKFISQVTDVTKWDDTFINLLAWRFAMELAMPVTGDTQKATYASQMYNFVNAYSKAVDASEGRAETPKDNRYINARR